MDYKFYVKFNENKIIYDDSIKLVENDYKLNRFLFEFDIEDGTKVFEMKTPSGKSWTKEIVDGILELADKNEQEETISILPETGEYEFEISLYKNDGKVTVASKGHFYVRNEVVKDDDEAIETDKNYPILSQLIEKNKVVEEQLNNLDLDASKSGKIVSLVITRKDGTTKTINIEDGMGLEYLWNGTSLGIKREDEENYTFVNLKGDKGDAGAIKMLIVAELPQIGRDDTIYLVPLTSPSEEGNNYAEYVYINNAWELLGKIGIQVDLTDYVKNIDYATSSKGGVIKVDNKYGLGMIIGGYLVGGTVNYNLYNSGSDARIISKGTLENVIIGKGLVSNKELASDNDFGLIKYNDANGFMRDNNTNKPYAENVNYDNYVKKSSYHFISKGTLENVLNARIGDISSVLDTINGEVI